MVALGVQDVRREGAVHLQHWILKNIPELLESHAHVTCESDMRTRMSFKQSFSKFFNYFCDDYKLEIRKEVSDEERRDER